VIVTERPLKVQVGVSCGEDAMIMERPTLRLRAVCKRRVAELGVRCYTKSIEGQKLRPQSLRYARLLEGVRDGFLVDGVRQRARVGRIGRSRVRSCNGQTMRSVNLLNVVAVPGIRRLGKSVYRQVTE
jgi:hypothetical protein